MNWDGKGGQRGSVECVVFANHGVGVPSHLAGGAAADSGGGCEGDFVRCRTDATGTAGCVVHASTCPAATAAATTTAAAACRVNYRLDHVKVGFDVLVGIMGE